jgi:AcrR family transcriptional regulator
VNHADTATLPETGERSSRKEQQILDAASRLFMAEGYGAVSMDAIAREAGVSKATLYARFRGKEELFAAIIGVACRRHAEALSGAEAEHLDVGTALRRMAHGFLSHILTPEGAAIYRIVIGETPRFPELGQSFFESGPRITLGRLAAFLEAADARGELKVPEPRAAAEQFAGMLKGELHLRYILGIGPAPSAADIERKVEQTVTAFLRAYRP